MENKLSDRELLEFAAKAYGIEGEWSETIMGGIGIGQPMKEIYYCNQSKNTTNYLILKAWNPLIDDGDALRLAVKLSLNLSLDECGVQSVDGINNIKETNYDDPYAATRRAIVIAAAEIGIINHGK